jgi:cytoskeletal protein CcmA (bactofilin family)
VITPRLTMAAVLALALAVGVAASERINGPNAVLQESRTIDDDLVTGGQNVRIDGTVNGDVMAMGANVTVSGRVLSDVTVAGANVVVKGPVGDDFRGGGASVVLAGPVTDNASIAGNNIDIQQEGSVGNDADLAGNSVTVKGRIGRDLFASGNTIRIGAEVGRNATVQADHLVLLPGAVIRGNLVSKTARPPEVQAGAQVLGQTQFIPVGSLGGNAGVMGRVMAWLWTFGAMTLLGSLLLAISRRSVERVAEEAVQEPGRSLGAGFLWLLLVPVIVAILCATVIGIPAGLILLASYVVIALLSGAYISYLVGSWLLGRLGKPDGSPYLKMAMGALLVSLALQIPYLGWVLCIVVVVLGVGALLLERLHLMGHLRQQGLA